MKRMSKPKQLLLAPHWYDVVYDPKILEVARLTGTCLEDDQKLVVASDLRGTTLREALLHEALHGVWHQTDLDNKYSDEDEESVIWSMSPRILSLIRDNREFIEWLLE